MNKNLTLLKYLTLIITMLLLCESCILNKTDIKIPGGEIIAIKEYS